MARPRPGECSDSSNPYHDCNLREGHLGEHVCVGSSDTVHEGEHCTWANEPPKPKYRVGPQIGRTIYRDNVGIGVMDDAADAAHIVKLLNDDCAKSTR